MSIVSYIEKDFTNQLEIFSGMYLGSSAYLQPWDFYV